MAKNILLTGGIGSGKSTCGKLFELLGVAVFHDDKVGKELSDSNSTVVDQIKELFGNDIYINNQLDRKKVASLVFSNPELLSKLSSIIHPAVQNAYVDWVNANESTIYTIRESALATSNSFNFDAIISVSAPLELRVKRVSHRDGIDSSDVLKRINLQITQEERDNSANFIVLCDDVHLVIPQIINIHNTLINS